MTPPSKRRRVGQRGVAPAPARWTRSAAVELKGGARGARAQGGDRGGRTDDGSGSAAAAAAAADTDTAASGRCPDDDTCDTDTAASGWCAICLGGAEESPPPLQRGCCCIGGGGLVHLACMARLAAHNAEQDKDWNGWFECAACKESFTGAMQHGLARAWWARVAADADAEEDVAHFRAAATSLASTYTDQASWETFFQLAQASCSQQVVLAARRQVLGVEHPKTLLAAGNLALTYREQGKYAEAVELQEEVLGALKRVMGAEHTNTRDAADILAFYRDQADADACA